MNSSDIFNLLKSKRVLLMGDLMLDGYTFGHAQRLSPEAPVPLISVEKESFLPGGGGNAVLNLLSLGMEVITVGRVGDDASGRHFLDILSEPNVDISGIIIDEEFKTPFKKRIIADNQQLLRVDYEQPSALSESCEKKIKEYLLKVIDSVSIVAISDYGKGFFTHSLLQFTIKLAKQAGVPIIVDPKGIDFSKYKGATLIKPNFGEAVAASGLFLEKELKKVATKIFEITECDILMVTRAKEGISIYWQKGEEEHFPATVHEVRDVTGAGDTVLAVITATLANGTDLKKGAILANVAAGIVIERVGCARVTREEIIDRMQYQMEALST